jgi:glycosyltransferase involved in cell wall biosynthesis
VHAFDTKPLLYAPIVARFTHSCQVVRTITGLGTAFARTGIEGFTLRSAYATLFRASDNLCTANVFQNHDDLSLFLERRLTVVTRSHVILSSGVDLAEMPAGADTALEQPLPWPSLHAKGRPVITMVARIIPEKGVAEFLASAAALAEEFPTAIFLVVGPIESRSLPFDTGHRGPFGQNVVIVGPRTDVPAILARTTVFVLPTYYREGIPRVLLEAGRYDLPVVTTDVPGCREVITDGVNGHLIPPRDVPTLVAAIRTLLRDPGHRRRLGVRHGKVVRETFDLPIVAGQYLDLYRGVLARS